MKTTKLILAVLVAAAAAAPALRAGLVDEYTLTVDVPYVSKYVFRGLQEAKASLQPSVEISADNGYAGVLANEPFTSGQKNELDFYAAYEAAVGKELKIDLGATEYYYPQGTYKAGRSDTSFEPFVGLTGGKLTLAGGVPLTPSLYTYYDCTLQTYTVQGSLGYSLPIKSCPVEFDFSASAGYVGVHNGADYTFWSGGLNIPYKLNKNAKITAGVEYTSSDLSGAKHNLVYFTIGALVGF